MLFHTFTPHQGDGSSPTINQGDVRPEIYLFRARSKGFHNLNGRENIGDTELKQIMDKKHRAYCQNCLLEWLMCYCGLSLT